MGAAGPSRSPRPSQPALASPSAAPPRASFRRLAARALLFYGLAASFLLASVAAHEYSHYAAHEGLGAPAVRFHADVRSADEAVLAEGPEPALRDGSTIVFLPSAMRQALTLGFIPASVQPDGGVLALTYLEKDPHGPASAASDGEAPWASVEGAPVTVAAACFALSLAWVAWGRSLPARAALLASAVAIGNTRHHMAELGLASVRMEVLTWTAFGLALALAAFAGPTFRGFLAGALRRRGLSRHPVPAHPAHPAGARAPRSAP